MASQQSLSSTQTSPDGATSGANSRGFTTGRINTPVGGAGGEGGADGEDPRRPYNSPMPASAPSPSRRPITRLTDAEWGALADMGLAVNEELLRAAPNVPQHSPLWHSLRSYRLTASEFAAAAGGNPHCSPQQLQDQKIKAITNLVAGLDPSEGLPNPRDMQHGIAAEPIARDAYRVLAGDGSTVTETGFHIHPTLPFIGASPDGIVQEPSGVRCQPGSSSGCCAFWGLWSWAFHY